MNAPVKSVVSCQVEKVVDCMAELAALFPAHWEEVGIFKDRMPLDPNFDRYLAMDRADEVLVVVVRRDQVVRGYGVFFIHKNMHYAGTLTAQADIFYIVPEERTRGVGKLLFTTAEHELKRRGVKLWWCGFKIDHDLDLFFHSLGFTNYEIHCAKWLGDDHASA